VPDAAPPAAAPTVPGDARGRAATRRALLDAAYGQFLETGYLRTTIGAVTARAGYTRGAFYSSFRSKEELVGALYRSANAHQVARLRHAVLGEVERTRGEVPAADAVPAALAGLAGSVGAEARWFGVVTELRGAAVHDAAARRVLLDAQEDLLAGLATLLDDVLARTGSRLDLPTRDVVAVGVGLYERAFTVDEPDAAETAAAVRAATETFAGVLRAVTR
jgi:AcrR family transcriptional regulator